MDGWPGETAPETVLALPAASSRALPVTLTATVPPVPSGKGRLHFEHGSNLVLTALPTGGLFRPGRYRLRLDQEGGRAPFLEADLRIIFEDGEMTLPLAFKQGERETETIALLVIPREATGLALRPRLSALHRDRVSLSSFSIEPVSKHGYYAGLLRTASANPWDAARLVAAVGLRTAREGMSSGAALLRQVDTVGLAALGAGERPPDTAGERDPYTDDGTGARWHWLRMAPFTQGADALILAAYSPDGTLSSAQKEMVRRYLKAGFEPLLVIATDRYDPCLDPGETLPTRVMIRENRGFDFGSWKDAIGAVGGLEALASLTLTNDSVWPLSARAVREAVDRGHKADATFLTRHPAVRNHGQSYFLTLRGKALRDDALALFTGRPYQDDKTRLIFEGEAKLSSQLEGLGVTTETLFPSEVTGDPTIKAWDRLIADGFPFVKLQLFRQGILALGDPGLDGWLSGQDRNLIESHLSRESIGPKQLPPPASLNVSSFAYPTPFNEAGVQNAWNPPPEDHRPVEIPLPVAASPVPGILGVIHCFYLDEAQVILDLVERSGIPMRLILTTDTEEKRKALTAQLEDRNIRGEAVLCPNQGRDVAPFLIELARDRGDEPLVFHLHTKKSKHNDRYKGWGPYLRHHLIGSRSIIQSILRLFDNPNVGLVYPEHHPEIVDARNWGYNFDRTRALLERLGVTIDARTPLEFPTGTMFFARREVLDPLLQLGLTYDDFDEEAGQVDGTLAHGIERTLLYLAEAKGFRGVKVLDTSTYPPAEGIFPVKASDLNHYLKTAARRLVANAPMSPPFLRAARQVYPVATARSDEPRRRLTLLVPTLKPEKVYGGIATALARFRDIIEAAGPETDTRVLVTSDRVDRPSLDLCTERLGRTSVRAAADQEGIGGIAVVPLHEVRSRPVGLRRDEIMIATAWWTADLGFRLLDAQKEAFGQERRLVYLIQDYEPAFYEAGTIAALAEATYQRPEDTFALVNSEELAGTFGPLTKEGQRMVLPFTINPAIEENLGPATKEPMILCYGRPSTPRNAFPLLLDALKLFAAREPALVKGWRIVFAGEDFPKGEIAGLANAEVLGKVSLEDYADLLSRSAVGVSLMLSPHPSYPPLEMARAGCEVVTNAYGSKDLSIRAPNITSVRPLTPETLAAGIADAVGRAKTGSGAVMRDLSAPPAEGWPVFDPAALVATFRD
jgi:hypothetical protein